MGGFILVSAIFSIAIFFVYPWETFDTTSQRLVGAIIFGGIAALIITGLSHCGFGGGETEIYYRR